MTTPWSRSTFDRRSLVRKSSFLALVAASGAVGLATTPALETLAQDPGATPAARSDRETRRQWARARRESGRERMTPDVANVPYVAAGTPQQVLDLYLPKPATTGGTPVPTSFGKGFPVVVWMHGGGWMGGDKQGVGVPYLLDDGYAIVSINYRLLQDAMIPAQIVDANAALAWVWVHAAEHGLDRERMVVAGGSAGGRLASLVAASANDDVTAFRTDPAVKIAGLIDFFGGTDSERGYAHNPRRKALIDAALTPEQVTAMLPTIDVRTYVDAGDPPTLIVHGDQDRIVPIAEGKDLAATMRAAGVAVTFEPMPGRGHGMIHYQDAAVQAIVRDFLATVIGPA